MFAKIQRIHFVGIGGIGMSGIAEVLLNLGYKVSGSDLKSSAVTQRLASLVAAVLAAGGLDPTVVVGGRVDAMGSNARLGKSQYLVAEADESDRSFLKLFPVLAIVTNIDREHMDCYRNMRNVKRAFLDFMDQVPFYGLVVVSNDDAHLRRLLPQVRRRTISYGTRRGSDFHIKVIECGAISENNQPISRFEVAYKGRNLGEFRLHVPGVHNVLNATAAIAVGFGLDISLGEIRGALENFRGVDRRFQLRGKAAGVSVIDDYGHHPTEIRATLAAAKQCGYKKIHVVFEPHRYTRTRDLMDEFAKAFEDADTLLVLDIYPASEKPIEGISGEGLVRHIQQAGQPEARYVASFQEAAETVAAQARENDMILTLGAGSVSQLGPMILETLGARNALTAAELSSLVTG